eukprot:Gb_01819 [translate_table: standard]
MIRSMDKYEKLEKFGEGSYGKAYKAKDKTIGQLTDLEKTHLEMEEEGVPPTALHLKKFIDFHRRGSNACPLSPKVIQSFMYQLCKGIAHYHSHGVMLANHELCFLYVGRLLHRPSFFQTNTDNDIIKPSPMGILNQQQDTEIISLDRLLDMIITPTREWICQHQMTFLVVIRKASINFNYSEVTNILLDVGMGSQHLRRIGLAFQDI